MQHLQLFLLSPNSLKMRDNSFSYVQYPMRLCSEALVFVLSSYISQCHHHRSGERTSFHILCLIAFLWMLVAIKHFPPALHTLILSYDKKYNRNFLCIRSVSKSMFRSSHCVFSGVIALRFAVFRMVLNINQLKAIGNLLTWHSAAVAPSCGMPD